MSKLSLKRYLVRRTFSKMSAKQPRLEKI